MFTHVLVFIHAYSIFQRTSAFRSVCSHMQRMHFFCGRKNQRLEEFPLRVCVYMSVFPHNKACSLIFNAAETTTSTQSEPGEACFPAQTNLPCQQETILRAAVWNASKHGSQHPRTLTPPNSIQVIFSSSISVCLGFNGKGLHICVLEVQLCMRE